MSSPLFEPTVETAVARVRRHEGRVCCYVNTRLDDALEDASRSDGGAVEGPLRRVPYGLKDEFDTPHLPTTAGSWRHRHRLTPGVTSAPFEAFEAAGAVLLGKTNLSDMGLAPEASSWIGGSTKNPFDPARTSGGSSGGSAAAVAYGFHGFDWGTDIGGSIRLPAAFCGVLGLKLSDSTWPLRELFPSVPPSLKPLCGQGPFTRTIEQMRAVLDAARPLMRTGPSAPFSASRFSIYAPLAGDWPTFAADVGPLLERATELPVDDRCAALLPPGEMRDVNAGMWASHFEELLPSDPSISLAEGLPAVVRSVLLRGAFGDRRFHPVTAELLLMIAIGRVTVFRHPERARAKARAVRDTFRDLWADGRVIVAPSVAFAPPVIGTSNRNPHLLSYTVAGNLADATGLAIPFGTFDGTLPRGIQLLGPPGSEDALLALGERIIEHRDRDPSLTQPDVRLTA